MIRFYVFAFQQKIKNNFESEELQRRHLMNSKLPLQKKKNSDKKDILT